MTMLPSIVITLNDQETQKNISIAIFAIAQATWFWTNILVLSCELRIGLSMFLQLNPYYEPFATLWTFTDPVFNFGRLYYPKILGFDLCPWLNMMFLNYVLVVLDVWLHGMNEMNSGEENPIMTNLSRNPKYTIIEKYLENAEPKTEQEWLESFSFEDIYFYKVPGASTLCEGPQIQIDTSLPIRDRLPGVGQIVDGYGISLDNNPLNFIYHIILEIIHIPMHLLQLLNSH